MQTMVTQSLSFSLSRPFFLPQEGKLNQERRHSRPRAGAYHGPSLQHLDWGQLDLSPRSGGS